MKYYDKSLIIIKKINYDNSLITFNDLKIGLVWSSNLEKVIIRIDFFCKTKRGCKVVGYVMGKLKRNKCWLECLYLRNIEVLIKLQRFSLSFLQYDQPGVSN